MRFDLSTSRVGMSGCLGRGISGKRVCPGTGEESLLAVIYVRILKGT